MIKKSTRRQSQKMQGSAFGVSPAQGERDSLDIHRTDVHLDLTCRGGGGLPLVGGGVQSQVAPPEPKKSNRRVLEWPPNKR